MNQSFLTKTFFNFFDKSVLLASILKERGIIFIVLLFLLSSVFVFPHIAVVRAVEDSWTSKKIMPTARNALGVVAVDGKIYALGGLKSGSPSWH